MAINGGKIEFGVGYKVDKSGLNELKSSFNEIRKILPSDLVNLNIYSGTAKEQMKQARSDFENMRITLDKVEKAFDDAFDSTTGIANLQKLNQSLHALDINKISTQFSKFGEVGNNAFYQLTKSALTTNMRLKENVSLLDKMGETFKNTIKWSIASSAINKFTGSIQQAYGYVKHLDTSLNDIRIVTNKSAEEMDKFAVSANKAAQSLGAATTDYTEASLIYYQQGLGDEEAQARAETTLKAANVTGQTGREVSEELTAVWNGYKVTAEETEEYVDKLAAVAASTASDLEELSTGMSKVASAANNMGVDVDQLNAQLATIISVTRQAPETAGTALKTIFARIEDLKLGGTDEDGIKLGQVSGGLESLGIEIKDAQGNLRNLGEVIEEIGGKWDTWTESQQSAIAQLVAGKRQYNNLLALFDNWDMYNKALDTSAEATGTLQHQQDIYMESTEAHLKQLETAKEDFFDSLINTNTINGLVDVLTKATNIFGDFIDGVGGGNNAFLLLGSTITRVFSKQLGKGVVDAIKFFQRIKNNAADLQAQLDNIQLFKNTSQYQNNEAVKALVNAQSEVSKYYGILNNEQINAANALAQQVGDAKQLETQWEKDTESLNKYMRSVQQASNSPASGYKVKKDDGKTQNINYNKVDFKDTTSQIALKGMDQAFSDSQRKINTLTNSFKTLQKVSITTWNQATPGSKKFNQMLGKVRYNSSEALKSFQTLNKEGLFKNVDQSKITKVGDSLQKLSSIKGPQEFEKEIQKLELYIEDIGPEAQELLNFLEKIKTQGNNIHFDAAQKELDEFLKSANIQNIATNIFNTIGAVGQFAGSINSLTNAFDILGDSSLSAGEKITQFLSSAGIGITMLITSGKQIISAFTSINAALNALNITKITSSAINKGLMIDENTLTAEGLAYIGVTNTATAATDAENIALLKKKLLLSSLNPILLGVTAGIAATVGVITLINHFHDEEIEKIKSKNDALIESEKSVQEEISTRKENIKSINELIDSYEAGNISQKEFLSQKTDLISKLDSEATAALNAATSYNEYKKALDEANKKEYENQKQSSHTSSAAAFENALIDMEEGYGYYDTDTQTWSGKGVFAEMDTLSESEYQELKKQMEQFNVNIDNLLKEQFDAQGFSEGYQLTIGVEDEDDFIEFTNAMESLRANGQTDLIPEEWQNQLKEFKDSEYYQTIIEQNQKEKEAIEGIAASVSGFSTAENIEQGKDAYKEFTEYLIKQEGYTLTEANEAWKNFLNTQTTEVASALKARSNTIAMTQNWGRGWQGELEETDFYKNAQEMYDNLLSQGFSSEELSGITADQWYQWLAIDKADQNEVAEKVRQSIADTINKSFKDFKADAINTTDSMQKIIESALSGSVETGEDSEYAKIKEQVDTLIKYYPELEKQASVFYNENIIGTEKWIDATYQLQQAFNALELSGRVEDFSEQLDKLNKVYTSDKVDHNGQFITVPIMADTKKFTETLEDIMDADYSINVEIDADMQENFDNLITSMESADEMAAKIGENFIVSAEDITEIAEAFPGILEGYTDLGNGTIQLNEEIAKSAIAAASDAEAASTDELVHEIENTNTKLEMKRQHYQNIIDIANETAEGEKDIDDAKLDFQNELLEVEKINQELVNQEEIDNANAVATNSNTNAGIVAENWQNAYYKAAEASISEAEIAIENAKQKAQAEIDAANGVKTTAKATGNKVSVGGFQGKTGSTTVIDTNKELQQYDDEDDEDYLNRIKENAQKNIDALNKQITANEARAVEAAARLGKSVTSNSSIGESTKEIEESQANTEEYLEREEDIYHNINLELDDIGNKLSRIQKIESHSWGASAQEALKKEGKLLDEQIEKYKEKAELQVGDLSSRRKSLEDQGFTFNDNGSMITNSEERLNTLYTEYNAMVDKYNAMSANDQELYKSTLEAKKSTIENIETAIEEYESTYSDYQKTLDDLLDKHYEEIENAVNQFNAEIDVHLELYDAEKEWNDFWKDVVEDVEDTDFAGQVAASMKQLSTLIGLGNSSSNGGKVGELTKHVGNTTAEVWKQINGAENGGGDSIFGDDTALSKETLTNYMNQLMTSLRDAEAEVDNIGENYLNILDKSKEILEDQKDMWEAIGNHIDHKMKMIEMIEGSEAFEDLEALGQERYQNNLNNIETNRIAVETYQKQMQEEQAMMATLDKSSKEYKIHSDAYEKASENYLQAVEDLDKSLEDTVTQLQEDRERELNNTLKTLDKALSSNMGIDSMTNQWKLVVEMQDYYLDNIERSIEMQSLQGEFSDVIESYSTQASVQKELLKFQDEEIAKLEQKNKLTQYDIDEVKARLEIKKAELALEEAQRNKSNMRLRRDNQGNYTYQYTANQDAIDEANNGILTAKKEWWELVKKRNEENTNALLESTKKYYQAVDDYAKAKEANDKQAMADALMRQQLYEQQMKDLTADSEKAKQDLFVHTREIFEGVIGAEEGGMLEMWGTTIQTMTDEWYKNPDSFTKAVEQGIKDIDAIQATFIKNTEDAFAKAGRSLDNYRKNSVDPTTESLKKMAGTNEDLKKKMEANNKELEDTGKKLHEAETAYNDYKNEAVKAIEAAQEAYKKLAETVVKSNAEIEASNIKAAESAKNLSVTPSGGGYQGGGNNNPTTPEQPTEKTYPYEAIDDPYGTPNSYAIREFGTKDKNHYLAIGTKEYLKRLGYNSGNVKGLNGLIFKSGGYTGDWNQGIPGTDNGRLAVLHQKELVLNEADTANLLKAVSLIRTLVGAASSADFNRIANNVVGSSNISAQLGSHVSSGALQSIASNVTNNSNVSNTKDITINADFSGVRSADEIYQALTELQNYNLQSLYS